MQGADGKHWDAIVIGSGIGGMAAAAALSKVGHKVLLLEQYQTLGGLTHSFSLGGFTWDAGIHYLSGIAPGDPLRDLLDWLSDTPIEFTSMGAVYDNLHIGDAAPLALSRPFEAQERDLKDRFPDEAKAIEAWTAALREGREAINKFLPTRAMPEFLGSVVQWWNGRAIDRWCGRTTQEVIDEITDNPELAAVFAAQWGDHGGRPSKASFAMHALISASYLESGSWYPVSGGAAFAEHILPTITAGEGEARASSRVETLLFENERVAGVRTADGEEFRADVVISNIGARETVNHLLPADCGHQDWVDEIRSLPPSIAHFSLFLGFEGDVEDAGATRSNHWIYPTGEVDVLWTDAPASPQ
ncbi:MAG: NAD(P)/FAD-dependent oxidoreductase, partial [Gemmatimonadota bacterium]|nr:NAD(P)/FAD-dependent oxidoreductase [Gemmatimonadota bacterium]